MLYSHNAIQAQIVKGVMTRCNHHAPYPLDAIPTVDGRYFKSGMPCISVNTHMLKWHPGACPVISLSLSR
jgi:hypothetical protein